MHETGVEGRFEHYCRTAPSSPPNRFRYRLGSHVILLIITHDDAYGVDLQAQLELLRSTVSHAPWLDGGSKVLPLAPSSLVQHDRIRGHHLYAEVPPGSSSSPGLRGSPQQMRLLAHGGHRERGGGIHVTAGGLAGVSIPFRPGSPAASCNPPHTSV